LSIPEDIAIIGVGNDEQICELSNTPLSSIELNTEQAGYHAARWLFDSFRNGGGELSPTILVHPLGVRQRRSTDILSARDLDVARAINFIRNSCSRNIGVDDVVKQTSVSKRILYDRFNQEIGLGIAEYIRKVRMDHFCRLLLETNLSVAEIAHSMGYASDANISRYFHKLMNMTPLAYRKRHAGFGRENKRISDVISIR
ncbi:MAG: helix-turn-helix domain-containing protein, partial [Planctomycetes bacterium]|nr:helix-turn-helix domain-containing protein [Planctomycetota bacterium]